MGISSATGVMTVDTWNSIAMVHSGGNIEMYVDDTRVLNTAVSSPTSSTCTVLVVGATRGTAFAGSVSNMRVTAGIARYTGATRTVPDFPFPTQ